MYTFLICNGVLFIFLAIVAWLVIQAVFQLLGSAVNEIAKRKNTPESVEKAKRDDTVTLLRHLAQLTEQDWRYLDTTEKFNAWCDEHGYPRSLTDTNHHQS